MVFDDLVPHINDHVFRKAGPDWRVWESEVGGHELTYVVKGKARYTVNGAERELESGDLLYLTEGDIMEAVTNPQNLMQCFTVNFAPHYPTAREQNIARNISPLFPMVSHIGMRQDVITLFREMTVSWNGRQQGYAMKTRALFMLILHRLSEIIVHDVDSAPGDYRVNRIVRYIAVHFAEKLTVKALAQQVNLDEDYCGCLFKRETGMTVHQYMTRVRVRNAEKMLQGGGYKIHEVAELCGFSDAFHFYKSFKSLRGFPPSRCVPR